MTATVHGIYKEGSIELLETPVGVNEGPVLVTLTASETPQRLQYLQRGKYRGARMSTEEDFKIAEWHGDSSFDDE